MDNSIYAQQNEKFLLECQLAQRDEYSQAKRANRLKSIMTLAFAIFSVVVSILDCDTLSALSSLFAVGLVVFNKYSDGYISSHKKSVFAQFSILAQKRDSLQAFLKDRGIPTAIHYPIILPKQKAFSYLKTKENFDNAIYASQNILSLPINPYLSINELRYITQSIGDFYG